MKHVKGLTLVEILVSLIIVGLIAAAVSAALLGGYYMLKQAEHKSRAMSITNVMLQGYLAKSYENLDENKPAPSGTEEDISDIFNTTQDNTEFNWVVNISKHHTGGPIAIPYKNIEVITAFSEKNTQGVKSSQKEVRLANMVPYPVIHAGTTRSAEIYRDNTYVAPVTRYDNQDYSNWTDSDYNWKNITNALFVQKFNYEVPKDLFVMYNIAISYDTKKMPLASHTVYTRCLLDGMPPWNETLHAYEPSYGVITRTPIKSQIFINNIFQIRNVTNTGKDHTIQIEWAKDKSASIGNETIVSLREYDITVLAVEHTDD